MTDEEYLKRYYDLVGDGWRATPFDPLNVPRHQRAAMLTTIEFKSAPREWGRPVVAAYGRSIQVVS